MIKFKLQRITREKKNDRQPDYSGFFTGSDKNDYYAVGWLGKLNSDLSIKVQKVDAEFLKNSYNNREYIRWKYGDIR